MLNYLKKSIRRKIARRITKEYPVSIDSFPLKDYGSIEFANWENPLVIKTTISSAMIDFFKQFIKPGDFIIDIGANTGDTTVPMAVCAGKTGLTLGVEPNPLVYKVLQQNALLNPDKTNIVPVPFAISSIEEEFYFISSEASFGNGGISTTKESKHGKFVFPQKIKGVNLKNYLEENYVDNLQKLSFIKIDTEGYDKEIIKSIKELLLQCRPVIIAESFGKNSDAEKEELYNVIYNLNYELYYFEDFILGSEVRKLKNSKSILEFKDTINIYAIPR